MRAALRIPEVLACGVFLISWRHSEEYPARPGAREEPESAFSAIGPDAGCFHRVSTLRPHNRKMTAAATHMADTQV